MTIRKLTSYIGARILVASICLLSLGACNGWIYEDEGDCSVHYRLKFRYDRNLKWADAFAGEVSSVHLYAFDGTGLLVWQQEETIDPAAAEGYSMELDVPAGNYTLLAWCGLTNDGVRGESFSVPDARIGATRIEELQCALNRTYNTEAGAISDRRLHRLFHGMMEVTLPSNDDGGSYDYTMYLTKNTNHVRVILQHLSGEDVDVNQFSFRVEDENGLMAHHNGLLDDENITYLPWKTQSGEAGVGKEDSSRAIINVKGAIADMTVGRMMADRRRKMVLTVTNSEGVDVARIPVIDYALLAKEYYEEEYGHTMTDQEFLDREDDYVMTLFLDENSSWISGSVLIHSWRIVTSEVEID